MVPLASQRRRSSDRWCCSRGVLPRARALAADSAVVTRYHAPADRPGQLFCYSPSPHCPVSGRRVTSGRHVRSSALCNNHPHSRRFKATAGSPDGGAGWHRFAPRSAQHRPRLAGVAVRGWMSFCDSPSPPLDADGNLRQTGGHLSPRRGIWCGIQLNTMRAHGIPSEWSVSCGASRQPMSERSRNSWGRSLGAVSGYAPAGLMRVEGPVWRTGDHAVAVDVQGGLHGMRYPFR
jgi:hypothetical protein